jgi:hypothetical protein
LFDFLYKNGNIFNMSLSRSDVGRIETQAKRLSLRYGMERADIHDKLVSYISEIRSVTAETLLVPDAILEAAKRVESEMQTPLIEQAADALVTTLDFEDRNFVINYLRLQVNAMLSQRSPTFENVLQSAIELMKANKKILLTNDGPAMPKHGTTDRDQGVFEHDTGGGRRVIRSTRGLS